MRRAGHEQMKGAKLRKAMLLDQMNKIQRFMVYIQRLIKKLLYILIHLTISHKKKLHQENSVIRLLREL